ncbi:hypothetical protein [Halomicrococcus sp. SG-WS-1]|uniref:RPA family protein n=1 Tax=Halomicrococcus sp. SG-WS-1 TaxID=3439057 RepID=UPI003F78BD1E
MSGQGGAGRREVAWRVFAAEYDDATLEHSDSDEERAPNYVVTPTGARINRLFVVGVLTEVEQVSDDVLRGRVVDPTGGFVVYAGQYQPDAMAFLERADPPAFVAVTGKARTFRPEDSDVVYTSVRPESINEVDAETRDRWTVQTAEQTLQRVRTFAGALESGERGDDLQRSLAASGVDAGLADGIPLALDHYGTTPAYLAAVHDLALDAARVVAGEIDADEVGPLSTAPDESGDVTVALTEKAPDVAAVSGVETGGEPEPAEEPDSPELEETEADVDAEEADEFEPEPEEGDEIETAPEELDEVAESAGADEAAEPTGEDESEPEVEDASDAAELEAETEDEPSVEPEQETVSDEEFEPEVDAETEPGTDGAADEMYEFDEGERERIEEEYGTEFSTATEVGEPGEAGIETPAPEDEAEQSADDADEFDADEGLGDFEPGETATDAEAERSEPAEDSESEEATDNPEAVDTATGDEDAEEESAGEPEDLENTVMRVMQDLNGDDGVEREQLLAAVVNRYDVTPADVEDALQDALMAGRCYESGEDTLKPI